MNVRVKFNQPEITTASDLNELAKRRGWAVLCDVMCRFTLPSLAELHSLWRSKAGPGGIPERSEMTPRLLKPYMNMLTLHERVAHPDGSWRYRVRLMGSGIAQVIGEVSGKFYDEFLPAKAVPRWNAMNDATLGHGAPVRTLVRADALDKTYLTGEFFSAPLLARDGTASLVLAVGRFDGKRRWEDVAAETRRQLGVEPARVF